MKSLSFALVASALACAACGAPAAPAAESNAGDGGSSGYGGEAPQATVTILEGNASERGLEAIRAARTEIDPLGGPSFDTPLGGSELDGAFTFTWHLRADASIAPEIRPAPSASKRGSMSGSATLITFGTDPSAPLMRLFTTNTSYTPDVSARKVLATGAWVFATLETASFEEDAIAPTSKPVIGESIPICVDMD